jgi:PEGA domain
MRKLEQQAHRRTGTNSPQRAGAIASILLTFVAARAAAEAPVPSPSFLVVPVTKQDERLVPTMEAAYRLDALLAARGVQHVPLASASADFESRHSKEPASWTQTDIDLLAAAARNALEAIVSGNYQEALTRTQEARQRADGALEVINRQLKWSRQAFDTCALEVRGRFEDGDREGALQTATRCKTFFPGFEPDATVHPRPIRDLFAQASREISRTQTRALVVESTPPGCTVFLNGRALGTTPYRQAELAAFQPRLQVECAQNEGHGRVHLVPAGTSVTTIHVDTIFERAVHSDGDVLRLVYSDADDPRTREHALTTAGVLGATAALAVSSPRPGRLRLTRYAHHRGGSVELDSDFTEEQLGDALQTLLTAADPEPTAVENKDTAPPSAPAHQPTLQRHERIYMAASGVAFAAAAASAVTGWIKFQHRRDDGLAFRSTLPSDPAYLPRQGTWQDERAALYYLHAAAAGLGVVGGTLLNRALPTVMQKRWVRLTAAGSGAVLFALGATLAATGERCDDDVVDVRTCVLAQHRLDRGGFLMLNAMPLLATPALSWVFAQHAGDLQIGASASARSAALFVRIPL